ncbi:hypothetical protein G647_00585 [Cladophialophora carrionii CBS 160.54]|uniref:N,N-dimethylformamidase beta subunit-like C-terminal domain-containing protein n=1 Tax=Cladophialophora carrionii CBS 160.54 TaxID=1279043 RepID=V9DN93_9EURO|nr:uncharacterized protein G647_00585 [Cladophialophora carrionii CBS 160.54]ETI28136.1 hypothetical protein G647_00585 [Cladophialophora carrionii CBS 160.54]
MTTIDTIDTIDIPPQGYPPEITGYADPWIANPGEEVAIKVSCTEPEYSHRTVRVVQGVEVEHSPLKRLEPITQIPTGTAKGRFQCARPGSYAVVEQGLGGLLHGSSVSESACLQVSLFFQAHLPIAAGPGHAQAIVSTLNRGAKRGFAVVINEAGVVEAWIGTGDAVQVVHTGFSPARQRWVDMTLTLDGMDCSLVLRPVAYILEKAAPVSVSRARLAGPAVGASSTDPLLFAATVDQVPSPGATSAGRRAACFFNGRIDSPTISKVEGSTKTVTVLAKYDFSRNMAEDTILDVSGNNLHGVLVNAPTRAVTGHDWDGSEVDWTKAKYGYGAIHFHEDDLDDARWDSDFTIKIPETARSGIYAVEVTSTNGKTSDMITFVVRPTPATTAAVGAKVAFVLSTFTYLAYANEKLSDTNRSSAIEVAPGFDVSSIRRDEDYDRLMRRKDLGLSNYDVHNDNSGVVFSSAKRPILNFRPGYIMWAFERPRELSADSMMIGLLERQGIPYDVVTDHDLHLHGAATLAPYNTILTGCHPEYPTLQSYNAYEDFARQGGSILYLGGNGFYWVSSVDPARPWRLEVRRGDQGVRSYALPGGERVMSLTGQQGGLWRSRGRSSHGLFGVAFCGEGTGPGVPFKRNDESYDSKFDWMFRDIPSDQLIGEYGLGGGASGDEIDSFDLLCGSPATATVIASSTGHSDEFGIAPECTAFPITGTLGTQTKEIRSDLVYYETDAGGAVFSVGSINWYCSLGWDDYANNVAKLTENVIREFMRRGRGGLNHDNISTTVSLAKL